jgi:serine/threonine protein kinase
MRICERQRFENLEGGAGFRAPGACVTVHSLAKPRAMPQPSPLDPARCFDDNLLTAFVEGRLDIDEASRVAEHVDACRSCHRLSAALARTLVPPAASQEDRELVGQAIGNIGGRGFLGKRLPATLGFGLLAGQSFARYRVERLLGRGGMGEVYDGYDTLLRRRVALKVLARPRISGLGDSDDLAKVLREARAAAALNHSGAVSIFDVGEVDGIPFIAMELLEGETLRAYVGRPDISFEDKRRWLVEVAQVLHAAHVAGLVHRDIKPDNIMVCRDGKVKVLDFGIAKSTVTDDPPAVETTDPRPPSLSFHTTEGRLRGTPRYMAPERFDGAPLDARSDQYSWGLLAYELIAGSHPARLAGVTEWPMRRPPRALSEVAPKTSPVVAACVMRTLEVDPSHRHASMEGVLAALAGRDSGEGESKLWRASETSLATLSSPSLEFAVLRAKRPRWKQLVASAAVAGGLAALGAAGLWPGTRTNSHEGSTITPAAEGNARGQALPIPAPEMTGTSSAAPLAPTPSEPPQADRAPRRATRSGSPRSSPCKIVTTLDKTGNPHFSCPCSFCP